MNPAAPTDSPRGLRAFLNRRQPSTVRILILLAVLATVQAVLPALAGGFTALGCTALAVTLAALVLQRWWSLPAAPVYPEAKRSLSPAAQRWTWLVAGAVAVLAMWPRSARLNHGLHSGEIQELNTAWALSREQAAPLLDGKAEPVGSRRLVEQHVAAQFAVEALGQILRDDAAVIHVRQARTLPWVAGIVGAGLVVLLAAALGNPRAGLAAGLVAGMHPLLIRQGSEVSDAALHLLWLGTALLAVIQALQTNQWRWWLLLGAAQGLRLLGDPGAWLDLATLNAGAAAVALTSQAPRRDRTAAALRLLVALAVAGAVLLIPLAASPAGVGQRFLSAEGTAQLLSGFSTESLAGLIAGSVWRWPVFHILLPLALAAGAVFLFRQDWRGRLALALLPAALAGSLPAAALLLPLLLVWAGVGLASLAPRQPRLAHAPLLLAILFVFTTAPVLQRVMRFPVEPLREALAAAQAEHEPGTVIAFSGPDSAAAGTAGSPLRQVTSVAELHALADAAFEKEHPLYVLARHTGGETDPLQTELEKGGRFVATQEFGAFEQHRTLRLYRYQPREQIIRMRVQPGQ